MPSFIPSTPPTAGVFTPDLTVRSRRMVYGDHPRLDGSIKYGQLIGRGGFIAPLATPSVGTFTPTP